MNCSELETELAIFSDGCLSVDADDRVKAHLQACPLCRQKIEEFNYIRTELSHLRRPEPGSLLSTRIKEEAVSQRRTKPMLAPHLSELLTLRIMPLATGVAASVLVGLTFLTMTITGVFEHSPINENGSVLLAANHSITGTDGPAELTPRQFADTRLGLGGESPSVNPQGALIALTRSLVRGEMRDDEVVVVADVLSNGLAKVAEVVEPPRNTKAISELQKALESDPAMAPFVPTAIENRPDSVRIVLRFQNVDVRTGDRRTRANSNGI